MTKVISTAAVVFFLFFTSIIHAQPGSGYDLDLNGTSQYANCGAINLSGSAITIQGWLKVQAFKTAFPYITSFAGTEQSGSQAAVRVGDASIPSNRVQFILYIGGTHYKLHTQTALSTNKWYHVAATYDGAQMKIYLNGVLDTIRNQTGSFVSNDDFELGRNYGNDRILNGELDEISVFKAALSEATLRSYMCKSIDASHPDYANLVGYWKLDEGNGSTAYDSSPYGNDGSIAGSPSWEYSGAPVGDASKYVYSSTFDIGLSHPDGDSMHIESTGGNFSGVHIYRVDSVPNDTTVSSPLEYIDSSRYWGVFPVGGADYDIDYYYSGNSNAGNVGDCHLSLGHREDNADGGWDNLPLTGIDYTNEILSAEAEDRVEMLLTSSSQGTMSMQFNVSEPLCFGDSNGLATASITGGLSPYTYDWSTGSQASSSGNVTTGTYTVTVTDDLGCESVDTVFIDEPTAVSVSGITNNSLCNDTNTGLSSVTPSGGVGGYTFLWNDPSGTTTNTATNLFPGTYIVTVTDSNGCSASESFTVGSTGPEPMPFLGNDTSLCKNVSYGLSSGSNGGPFVSWNWSTGHAGAILVITQAGTYTITVSNAQGCSASDTINIGILNPIQVNLGNNNQTGVGSVTLDAGAGFIDYLWNTGSLNQSITVTQSGTYWVHVTDTNGCESGDTVKVKMAPAGLHELSAKEISVYPNPVNNVVYVTGDLGAQSPFWLYAIDGKLVRRGTLNKEGIHVEMLPDGMYFIKVESIDSGESFYARFLKK